MRIRDVSVSFLATINHDRHIMCNFADKILISVTVYTDVGCAEPVDVLGLGDATHGSEGVVVIKAYSVTCTGEHSSIEARHGRW